MLKVISDACKALSHDYQAWQAESIENRLRKEFGQTGQVGQDLRVNAAHHRQEAAILRGEITPVNKEYVD